MTGASSGIGRAVALRLAGLGLRVALVARRADRLADVVAEIQAAGGQALALPCDVRDLDALARAFQAAQAAFGPVQVLLNNAGFARQAPLLSGDPGLWRAMLEVNVLALAAGTRLAVEQMQAAGRGHIFHLSSMSAHRVPPGSSGMYAATKHAVKALTEVHRQELHEAGLPIRVTALSPGYVKTEFVHTLFQCDDAAAEAVYAGIQSLDPDDVADALIYALQAPPEAQVHDILLRPRRQQS
ncbi:MAG: SDR family NAD(P)-dependent oxidoreductase [Myxococcales bacterium]|nr:SDR family NAD(P)-dependent oxidoreductase [Myxococcales bacterium]